MNHSHTVRPERRRAAPKSKDLKTQRKIGTNVMAFWIYMLRCADDSFYLGHTDDLERRIGQHHAGEVPGYTHERRPLTLVFSQSFPTREEALAAERQVKGWSRAKKQALISGDWESINRLGRGKHRHQR